MPSSWERSWVNLGLKEAEGDVGEGRAAERERRTCSDHSTLRGNGNDDSAKCQRKQMFGADIFVSSNFIF